MSNRSSRFSLARYKQPGLVERPTNRSRIPSCSAGVGHPAACGRMSRNKTTTWKQPQGWWSGLVTRCSERVYLCISRVNQQGGRSAARPTFASRPINFAAPSQTCGGVPCLKTRPQTTKVIRFRRGKMGVSAVPGSGKTHTLSHLAAQLIVEGYIKDDQEVW